MRKYSVLFVDDEEIIRESFLHLIDWENSRFTLAGICKNGEAAWARLLQESIDIVVTDINMPFMSGIELLENVRSKNYHTRFLFLTGYEFFEYARKAVQLQAFDFLLKPVSSEKLLEAIERAANDIEQEEWVQLEANKGLEWTRIDFLNDVLYDKVQNLQQQAQRAAVYCGSGSYLLLLVTIDILQGQRPYVGQQEEIQARFQAAVVKRKEQLEAEGHHRFEVYLTRDQEWNLRLFFISVEHDLFDRTFGRNFVQGLFPSQKEYPGLRFVFTAGRCHSAITDLRTSYRQILQAAEQRHTLRGQDWQLIFADDYTAAPADPRQEVILPTDTLLHHIRMGAVEEARQDIASIFAPYHTGKYISLESAKMLTTELAVVTFKGAVVADDQSVSYLYYLNHIQQLHTLEELERDITQLVVQVTANRKESSSQKKGMAEQALAYLREHYQQEDLSLNHVAEALNVSVSYLAVLFKQETGQNFSAHLLTLRMEKAKELLRTTQYSVAEIAELVGYNSTPYFTVRFKKYTGVPPGSYREQG